MAYESWSAWAGALYLMASATVSLDAAPWMEINDGVMGGVSSSRMSNAGDALVFAGTLSLENNGGFASARRPVDTVPDDCDRVRIEVRGDGRRYQFRIRQDGRFDGVAWTRTFATSGDWQSVELPIETFVAVFRGTRVSGAGPVEPGRIRQIGFMLADRQPGPFRLEIRAIEFMSPETLAHAAR